MATVKVKYKCNGCSLHRSVDVPERGDGDLLYWIDSIVMPGVALDHKKTSGGCQASQFDVMFPIGEDGRVGTPGSASPEVLEEYKKKIDEMKGEPNGGGK